MRRKGRGRSGEGPDGPQERPRDPFEMACRYLAISERCSAQVRDYLKRKVFEEEEIARTIEILKSRRLVDDARFAKLFVENRCRRSPRSRALLIKELRVKGIDAETARQVVADFLREVPEEELARRVVERLPSRGVEDRERAARRLRSRGFHASAALGRRAEDGDPETEGEADLDAKGDSADE